jgi:hypothetical protein
LAEPWLPRVIGDTRPEPPKAQEHAILREVQALAESMTAENWEEKKATLLAMLALPSADDPIGH